MLSKKNAKKISKNLHTEHMFIIFAASLKYIAVEGDLYHQPRKRSSYESSHHIIRQGVDITSGQAVWTLQLFCHI